MCPASSCCSAWRLDRLGVSATVDLFLHSLLSGELAGDCAPDEAPGHGRSDIGVGIRDRRAEPADRGFHEICHSAPGSRPGAGPESRLVYDVEQFGNGSPPQIQLARTVAVQGLHDFGRIFPGQQCFLIQACLFDLTLDPFPKERKRMNYERGLVFRDPYAGIVQLSCAPTLCVPLLHCAFAFNVHNNTY